VTAVRAWIVAILLTAAVAGGAMWYLQVYGFYEELGPEEAGAVTILLADGTAEAIPTTDLRAIERASSPISYRSCFTTTEPLDSLTARAEAAPPADPRNAPGWFDCFDAAAISAALESGEARAFLSARDVQYGIDRIVAILPDGRGFGWHDINACGAVVFDGDPPPEGCPPVPEGTQ
jgi:hypothetical protein